ncbi:MAG: serine/threonine protein kinase [FCB group bacterium]|nr:serine/threonine protein kinase [FCB group bacterium]
MSGNNNNKFPECYRDIKKIGQGGTAEIFKASLNELQRPVALKLFFDRAAVLLVEREQAVAGRINFPGIVKVEKSGQVDDGRPFLQMEYRAGTTLENIVGRVTEEKLLSTLSAAAVSLEQLHRAGFSHNDLKPSNLFAPEGFEHDDFPSDSLYYLGLADMSLALPFENNVGGLITGTVGYMSPEMILKQEITPASDLFSLGVMAYYLACGRMPFGSPDDDPLEVNACITEGIRPELCGPASEFSSSTAELIKRLIAIGPQERPATAFELQDMLADCGSPYPFRQAIRPRHLLYGNEIVDIADLEKIFGPDCFSSEQSELISQATAYDPAALRILLEHNFRQNRFARLDRRWGWTTDTTEAVAWPPELTRFSLRSLRGRPHSHICLALALAVVNNPNQARMASGAIAENKVAAQKWWMEIPEKRRFVMLHSLNLRMSASTKNILSGHLAELYSQSDDHTGLTGRLLYDADRFAEAVNYLTEAAVIEVEAGRHKPALGFLQMAEDAARRKSDSKRQVEVVMRRARLLKELGQLTPARDGYNHAIELAEKNHLDNYRALAYKELGDIFKVLSDYNSGIAALNQALELFRNLDDTLELSRTLNNLGNIYWVSGKNDQALEEYKKALEIQTRLDSRKDIASSLSNIGSLYLIKGEYDEGIGYLNRSLTIKEKLGDKVELARTWNNLGVANHLKGDLQKALEAYKYSLQYNRQAGDKHEQLLNITNLTEVMVMAGRLSEGLTFLKEGSILADKIDNNHHRSTISQLTGSLLCRMGFYGEAASKLETSLQIAEQLDNRTLIIGALISLVRLSSVIGDKDSAKEYREMAQREALAIGDKNALFHLALLQMELTGENGQMALAEKLSRELEIPREIALYNLTCLEVENHNRLDNTAIDYLKEADHYFSAVADDIDLARYSIAAGMYYMLSGDRRRAAEMGEKALKQAQALSLLPEQWQASALISEIMFAEREYEISFRHALKAAEILKTIASRMGESEKLAGFYNDRRIVDLLGRIKSLKEIIANKKGVAQQATPQ